MLAQLILASLSASTLPPQSIDPLQFRSAAHTGDMFTSTVSADGNRAYVSEGDQVTILDISSPTSSGDATTAPVIARVPVNASIMALTRHDSGTDKSLFIAGGSFGLLKMNVTENSGCSGCGLGTGNCYPVTTIDDRADPSATPPGDNDKWCWDVCVADVPLTGGGVRSYVVALFSAQDDQGGSELRFYRRTTMAYAGRIDLHAIYGSPVPTAFGYALGVSTTYSGSTVTHGSTVFVAMGTGGVVRVDLTPFAQPALPVATIGCIFTANSIPNFTPVHSVLLNGVPLNGIARDVAVASDGTVYAAVDAWGVVQLDPANGAPLRALNLDVSGGTCTGSCSTEFGFAHHVETLTLNGETHVLVGCERGSAVGEPAAPYAIYGRFTYQAGVGGDIGYSSDAGSSGLFFFRKPADGTSLLGTPSKIQHDPDPNVDLSCGNFSVRPDSTSSTNMWVYEQAASWGGNWFYTPPSTQLPIFAGFQPQKFSLTDYSWRTALYHAGTYQDPVSFLQMLISPNTVILIAEGAVATNGGARYVDLTDRDCIQYVQIDPTHGEGNVFGTRAHWLTGTGDEWWITSQETGGAARAGFRLVHSSLSGGVPVFSQWSLRSPRQPDCFLTRNYHRATDYVDPTNGERRVMGTFLSSHSHSNPASPWAGVMYRADTLMNRSALVNPGCALFPLSTPPPCADSSGTPCYDFYPDGTSNLLVENYVGPVVVHPELFNWTIGGNHAEGEVTSVFTGETLVVNYDVGGQTHAFALVAAGSDSNDEKDQNGVLIDPNYSKAMLTVIDLDAPKSPLPTTCSTCQQYPTVYYGPDAGQAVVAPQLKGMSTAIELVTFASHKFALVTDFGGRLHIFDVTDPAAPTYRQTWTLPLNVLDGYIDNVLDVEADTDNLASTGSFDAYMTAFRAGIIRLTLSYNSSYDPNLPYTDPNGQPWVLPASSYAATNVNVKKIDTPGLAHELKLVRNATTGGKGFIVADNQGGLRVYGDF